MKTDIKLAYFFTLLGARKSVGNGWEVYNNCFTAFVSISSLNDFTILDGWVLELIDCIIFYMAFIFVIALNLFYQDTCTASRNEGRNAKKNSELELAENHGYETCKEALTCR